MLYCFGSEPSAATAQRFIMPSRSLTKALRSPSGE